MALEIDGRFGEGGGQVLRTALSLAALLQGPLRMKNIRGGRRKQGLRPQHLMAVKALALLASAHVEGAELGSTDLYFEPGRLKGGTYTFHVGTAGSTSLVLQTLLPALFFADVPSRVTVTGGTHVPWSPCFHYLKNVFAPAVREMGGVLSLEIGNWGWYPKGGGELVASVSPIAGFHGMKRIQRGRLEEPRILSAVSNLPMSIAKRQRDQAIRGLQAEGHSGARIELVQAPSLGAGTLVFIEARFERGGGGFSSLGKRGKRAEKVADEACSAFVEFMDSQGAVDHHLADQLVLYMALAHGRSSFAVGRVTRHLLTNIGVIEQFLPVKFQVEKEPGRVGVEGAGFSVSAPSPRS
ncbi:MAG: RNA 3'-terminal phosphate cyclase [Thermodesulfobacteriota bacterium]|nr:RNA 3'-terminal phosphate cyclase [Thermodesulfobacteriota bacterium]